MDQFFWKQSVFVPFFVQRVIIWIKSFESVRLRAIFSKLEKFRIESFRTCHVSKKKVLHRIRFWSGIDLYKNRFWWMFCFQKVNFGSSYTTKTPTFAVMRFLKNHQLVKRMEENTVSFQDFWKESDFETSFQQRVRLWIKNFGIRHIFSQLYITRHFLNRIFYSVLDCETSFLPHVRFWTEVSTTQQIFTWNSFWKIKFSWTIRSEKFYYFLVNLHHKNV